METKKLNAEKREKVRKHVKEVRQDGNIPAVVYGKGIKPVSLAVDKKEFIKLYKQAGENTLIDLSISGNDTRKILISEVQLDPITDAPIHIDFHQVKLDEKVTTEIPLEFINEEASPAVKELGGTIIKEKDVLEVESLPSDIPHDIEVDLLILKTFSDMIRVSDLKVPSNVKVLNDLDEVVVLVEEPRSEEELKELEAEVVEDIDKVGAVEQKEEKEEKEEASGEK